jgi:hypothetical protein
MEAAEDTGDVGGVSLQVGVGSSSVQCRTILDKDGGSPSSSTGLAEPAEGGVSGGACETVTGLGLGLVTASGYTSS